MALDQLYNGQTSPSVRDTLNAAIAEIDAHEVDSTNPHGATLTQQAIVFQQLVYALVTSAGLVRNDASGNLLFGQQLQSGDIAAGAIGALQLGAGSGLDAYVLTWDATTESVVWSRGKKTYMWAGKSNQAATVTTGDAEIVWAPVGIEQSGFYPVAAYVICYEAPGGTGNTTINFVKRSAGTNVDLLSTNLVLAPGSYYAVSTDIAEVSKMLALGDAIGYRIDAVSSTAPYGLMAVLVVQSGAVRACVGTSRFALAIAGDLAVARPVTGTSEFSLGLTGELTVA